MTQELVEIVFDEEPFSLNVKRLYLPATVWANCPHCGEESSCDLENYPLDEPSVGRDEVVGVTCVNKTCPFNLECFYVCVRLEIGLIVASDPLTYEQLKERRGR